jgi:L-threonate 2-dehydrogenase
VLEAGRDAKAALPLAAAAHQLFLAASGRGDGAADDSQVIKGYHLLNGVRSD